MEYQTHRTNPNEKNTIKDIIAKKFPELENAGIQIQGVQRVPAKRDPNKICPRHIIVRMMDAVDRDKHCKQQDQRRKLHTKEHLLDSQQTYQKKPSKPEDNGGI